ncbi:MAG: LemA family protein [Chitinophagia bacterium]|nr:LemA family protein [Chitinophagia bacterium]
MSTRNIVLISIVAFILLLGGCGCSGYNGLVQKDQNVKSKWANVESDYHQKAQGQLSGAIGRLLVSVERYPELKATEAFRDLQAQLEGTENRIKVSRNDFNAAVQDYNTSVKKFPMVLFSGMFGFNEKGYFTAEAGAEKAPTVDFNK